MEKKSLKYLCCPACKSDLRYKENKLTCKVCKRTYAIKNGMPVLIDMHNLPEYLTHQIAYFEEEDKTRPVYKLDAWQESYLRRFYENVDLKRHSLVLDIGCGSGYMAVELAKKGAIVIASDLTLAQLKKLSKTIAQFHLESRLFLVCCSAESLPFKSNIADVVIENAILEHLPNEKSAIAEITRVSKRDSALMVSVPHAYKYIWPFFIPINIWYDKKIGHLRRYTKEKLIRKFAKYSPKSFYYTGNILKFSLFTLAMILRTKVFDSLAESLDDNWKDVRYGATVITVFFRKIPRDEKK